MGGSCTSEKSTTENADYWPVIPRVQASAPAGANDRRGVPPDGSGPHRAATWCLQLLTRLLQYQVPRADGPGWVGRASRIEGRPTHGSRENIVAPPHPGADRLRVLVHSRSPRRARVPGLADPGRPAHQRPGADRDLAHLGLPRRGRCVDRGRALPVRGTLHLHGVSAALRRLRLEGRRWRGGHRRGVLRLVPSPRRPARLGPLPPEPGAGWVRCCSSASRSSGSGRGPA